MPRRRPRRLSLSEDECDDDDGRERPQQRNAANARERARMRVLSRAFCRLKTTLPWVPPDTKLSKLDTLRLATSYIAHLRAVLCLEDEDDEVKNTVHPLNLTWPFSFQQPGTPSNPPLRPPWELSPPPSRPRGEEPLDYPVTYPQGYSDPLAQMG
ncbi:transcription factor 21-like [Macrosteles quadrilineatus]|uniref:transcription factor 21-like n=1 Tax=Macrosteles quadrilineatus TaxID=74068 RepID=UPI0023E18DD8|nr:transcription factor 21-like [Macrosteles quadrilineatus]